MWTSHSSSACLHTAFIQAAIGQVWNRHSLHTGGGGIAVGGVETNCEKLREKLRKKLRKIVGKLRKIAGKLRKIAGKLRHCKQPSVTFKVQQFWTGGSDIFPFSHTKGPRAAQLQEAPLNITMELKHEPKAADVVIQFVLPLRNRPTL